MDITPTFSSLLFDNRSLNGYEEDSNDMSPLVKNSFTIESERLSSQLNTMHSYIKETAGAYLRVFSNRKDGPSSNMSESERDEMDAEVTSFAKQCYDEIEGLNQLIVSFHNKDGREHGYAVIEALVLRLKSIMKTYEQMQKQRTRHGKIKASLIPENTPLPTFKSTMEQVALSISIL